MEILTQETIETDLRSFSYEDQEQKELHMRIYDKRWLVYCQRRKTDSILSLQ